MSDMIQIKGLNKYFGDLHVLKDVNLNVKAGEKLVVIGPSGSGKSTLIRCVDFLEEPTSGEVIIDGTPLTKKNHLEMARKYSSMVFQQFNLYPNMTVLGNLTLAPIKLQKKSKEEANKIAMAALERVGLAAKAGEYPQNLSGGQQQRVAIARAIASEPHLLLMDEPLSNLDAKLRVDMRSELKRLHTETGTTMIYVTHDQVEALTMSTKIAIFREGIIIQVAHPLELYNNPANLYVADFIGNPRINFVDGKAEVSASGLTVNSVLGRMTFPADHLKDENMPQEASFDAVLGIRPEQIAINTSRQSPSDIEAHIYTSMPAGSETLVTVKVGGVSMVIKALGITHYNPDQVVYLSIDTTKINVFDKKTENLIKYSVE